jgi:hypothetical protein
MNEVEIILTRLAIFFGVIAIFLTLYLFHFLFIDMPLFCDKVMKNDLDNCSDQELETVLVTCDGRGPYWKQKALDILKQRWQDKAQESLRRLIDGEIT